MPQPRLTDLPPKDLPLDAAYDALTPDEQAQSCQFVALRHAVVSGLQHAISAGNIRVLLWAADRLNLGGTILPKEERSPRPRPTLRRHRPPPAVRDILAAAAQAAGLDPAPPAPAPIPADATDIPAADIPAPATAQEADMSAGDDAAPLPDAAATAPTIITLAPRRAREPLRRLLGRMRPIPELADGMDWRDTEALILNSQQQNHLPRLICDAAEPLNPYRPLRQYRWP